MAHVPHAAVLTASSDRRLVNLLGAVATGMTDAMQDAICADTELDLASATALIALLDFAPRGSVQILSRVIGLTHSGTVRLVDRLETAGYLARRPGRDARSRSLTLTATGATLARRARRARERAISRQIEHLSKVERTILAELCERLVRA